jgi:hypothetical protein
LSVLARSKSGAAISASFIGGSSSPLLDVKL